VFPDADPFADVFPDADPFADVLPDADPFADVRPDVLPVPAAEVPQAARTSTQTRGTIRRMVGPRIRVAAVRPTTDRREGPPLRVTFPAR
jgi:hypothetical protein